MMLVLTLLCGIVASTTPQPEGWTPTDDVAEEILTSNKRRVQFPWAINEENPFDGSPAPKKNTHSLLRSSADLPDFTQPTISGWHDISWQMTDTELFESDLARQFSDAERFHHREHMSPLLPIYTTDTLLESAERTESNLLSDLTVDSAIESSSQIAAEQPSSLIDSWPLVPQRSLRRTSTIWPEFDLMSAADRARLAANPQLSILQDQYPTGGSSDVAAIAENPAEVYVQLPLRRTKTTRPEDHM